MDEIENIIIHSLRQIGCEIDGNTLSSLEPEIVIKCVSRCLRCIDPTLDLPQSMPSGMAQRYGVTLSLAERCTEIGFRGDIGYQTFLHSNNVVELRRVLMFLIDKLPKDEGDSSGQVTKELTTRQKLDIEMRKNLAASLKGSRGKQLPDGQRIQWEFKAANDYDPQRSISSQTTPENLLSTIIVHNASGSTDRGVVRPRPRKLIGSASVSTATESSGMIVAEENVAESAPIEIDPVEEKRNEIDILRTQIMNRREEKRELEMKIERLKADSLSGKKSLDDLKLEKKIKERTLLVLENPAENMQKLQKMIENSKEKMKRLQDQWLEHRTPLEEQIEAINAEKEKRSSKTKVISDQIAAAKQKQHVIRTEMESKSQMYAQLMNDLGKVNQKIDRSAYTTRIYEIIGNIRKQKTDIDKILRDTKEVQKEINTVTGKLERQFTVTDDLLFGHAKRDEQTKRAYKLFLKAHSDCGELAKSIQETGKISRELRDLEDQIENSRSRNTAANLQQVSKDLEEMTAENEKLFDQIQRERATLFRK